MTTRWTSPLTEARPPARHSSIDWLNVVVWLGIPLLFWGGVGFTLYWIGWL
jgi:hypothetical protein